MNGRLQWQILVGMLAGFFVLMAVAGYEAMKKQEGGIGILCFLLAAAAGYGIWHFWPKTE